MNYDLTPNQRDLIKAIVEEVRAGNLKEETRIIILPNGIPYFTDGYIGKTYWMGMLTEINLQALEREGLIMLSKKHQQSLIFAPTNKAYEAVDSEFGASTTPSAATSSVTVQVNNVALARLLDKYFDLNELEDLCFKASVKYDNVRGDTLSDKCRNLINYMTRRNQLMSLIITAVKERPDQDWSDLY